METDAVKFIHNQTIYEETRSLTKKFNCKEQSTVSLKPSSGYKMNRKTPLYIQKGNNVTSYKYIYIHTYICIYI